MPPTAGTYLSKASRAAALTPPARHAHLAVLAAFAQAGQAPGRDELERIARAQGAGPAAALAELALRNLAVLSPLGLATK